jgi:hypothetical protein
MECTLVKPGYDCSFMNASGCGFGATSETCHTIVDQCEGCDRIHDWPGGRYCTSFAKPAAKWAQGMCNFATHAKIETAKSKKKVNPLKAAKKGMSG